MPYLNYYICPCGKSWVDKWSCMCNDRCPMCNAEIEPYRSVDLPDDEGSPQDQLIGA